MVKGFKDIENYIVKVKAAICAGRYRIERNNRRQANLDLYKNYVIDETKSKQILLELNVSDFCEVMQNEHVGYEHELLYVFGKDVKLLQRFGTEEETVSLYIKFNQLENEFVIVISFHRQVYPLRYAFKKIIR